MRKAQTGDEARGRSAEGPTEIPARGLWEVLKRVLANISEDSLSLIAAGVSFYVFLSLFPAITALLSVYGIIADPAQISRETASFGNNIPPAAMQIVTKQMSAVAGSSGSALSVGFGISLVLAIYYASGGMGALISALNIVYGEHEKRGFIRLKLVTLGLTFAMGLFTILMLAVIGMPAYLQFLNLPGWFDVTIRIVCWIVMLIAMVVGLSAIYAVASSRRSPKKRWVTPGSVVATLGWLIVSIAFSFYIDHFGNYNKTYGSIAAIIILMLWFWISVFVVLLGGELNAELERQTRKDSTVGKPREIGRREAVVADKVADTH